MQTNQTTFWCVRVVMESARGGASCLVDEYLTDTPPAPRGTHYELQDEDDPEAGVIMTMVTPVTPEREYLLEDPDLPCYFRGKRIR